MTTEFVQTLSAQITIRVRLGKLGHVFQIPHRIPCTVRKGQADICCEVINEFVPPCLVLVDHTADAVVQQDQISIDMNSRPILSSLDLLLDLVNCSEIFTRIHQQGKHLLS